MNRYVGKLKGKRACVLGSGDNYAVFALAGMGAEVTSVDISERQLDIARERAQELKLKINFVRADVTELPLNSNEFDFACSSGTVAVWIAELEKYYSEACRIVKPGCYYMISESHPVRNMLTQQNDFISIESNYFNNGPYKYQYRKSDGKGAGSVVDDHISNIIMI